MVVHASSSEANSAGPRGPWGAGPQGPRPVPGGGRHLAAWADADGKQLAAVLRINALWRLHLLRVARSLLGRSGSTGTARRFFS
jgi:hypothetical protein